MSTIVSRLQLDHPALGAAGGSGLHAAVEAIYTKIGNNISSRILVALNLNNLATATLTHDFLTAFGNLRYDLYLYDEVTTALTRLDDVSSPLRSAFAVTANGTNPTTQIDVVNNSGAQRDLALVLHCDVLKLAEGDVKDIDITTTAPQDGQALVWDAASSKFLPGASGDASFKLQAVTTPNLSLKGGSIIDGDDEYVTYDGSGALSTDYGVDLTLNLTTILGSAPANATAYFLFIDKRTLSTEVTLTDSGRQLYAVQQANFVLSTTRHRDPERYVYVGFIRSATTGTAWSGTGAAFGTEPFRRHDRMSRFFSVPEVYSNVASPITAATATNTLSHGLSGKPQNVLVTYYDGTNEYPLEPMSYVKNITATQIIVSSLGLTFGGTQEVRVYATRVPTQLQVASPANTQVFPTANTWYTSSAVTAQAHGMTLDDIRGYVVQEKNTVTGAVRNIDPSGIVVNVDATNFNLNWTGISFTNLQYRIVASSSPIAVAVPLAYGGYTKFVGMGPGSYATMTAALAASTSGDRILVARDTDETADLSVPAGVTVRQMPGTTVRIAGALTNGVRFTGAKAGWEAMNVKLSPTGTQAKGVSVEAADCYVEGCVELATAQTVTDMLNVATAGVRARVDLAVLKTLGTITNLETVATGAGSTRTSVIGG
jgi:hypothetical protein